MKTGGSWFKASLGKNMKPYLKATKAKKEVGK
jgi:hypothetical protein